MPYIELVSIWSSLRDFNCESYGINWISQLAITWLNREGVSFTFYCEIVERIAISLPYVTIGLGSGDGKVYKVFDDFKHFIIIL